MGAGIFGAVPLGLQENAKGGEAWTQLACAQTSVHAPPTHSSASQEEARPVNQAPGSGG